MVWPARDKAALSVCVRDQQLGPAEYREEETPTSAAVPPHWIWSDGSVHRRKETETDRASEMGLK